MIDDDGELPPYDHEYEGEFSYDPGWDPEENKAYRKWWTSLEPFNGELGAYYLMCFNDHGAYEACKNKVMLESMGWHFRDKLPPVMFAPMVNRRGLMYARRLSYCWPVKSEEE